MATIGEPMYAYDSVMRQWVMMETFLEFLDRVDHAAVEEEEAAGAGDVSAPAPAGAGDAAPAPGDASAPAPAGAGGVSAPAPHCALDLWTAYSEQDRKELEAWLADHKTAAPWRQVLNNHTTNRAKKTETVDGRNVGGSIIPCIRDCHLKTQVDDGRWEVTMNFPNSLEPGDGQRIVHVYRSAVPEAENAAMEACCKEMFTHLLLRGPWQVSYDMSFQRPPFNHPGARAPGPGLRGPAGPPAYPRRPRPHDHLGRRGAPRR